MTQRYRFHSTPTRAVRTALSAYSDLVQTLLHARNITTDTDAAAFLNPDYDAHVHDPFAMRDMERAVERITHAIESGEHIAVYSDFDADGISGGVLLHDLFRTCGVPRERFTNYIPHRDAEGYGFHGDAVSTLKQQDVTLIITVDVGTASSDAVDRARELGIDVIITDHHLPTHGLPDAYAVLNPHRDDETYPFADLCGTGVAFKLATALIAHGRAQKASWVADIPDGWEKWLLDVVAIATVADMMPLVGENRALVHWGLVVLRKSRRVGIRALCKKLRLPQHLLTEEDIGFAIAPRLNTASRMAYPELGFTLLTTEDEEQARATAAELETLNNKRKGQVAAMVRELTERFGAVDDAVLVAGNPSWNPALLGLAANSLVQTYGKVVCLWGREGTGTLKGSCRGNGAVGVTDLLAHADNALLQFGGHEHAGGFSVKPDAIHTLGETLNKAYATCARERTNETLTVDAALSLSHAAHTHRAIAPLRPFGVGNDKPLFACERVTIAAVKQFGKQDAHLEVHIAEGQTQLRAIAFYAHPEQFTRTPSEGETVTLIGTLEQSHFAGRTRFELRIVDIV